MADPVARPTARTGRWLVRALRAAVLSVLIAGQPVALSLPAVTVASTLALTSTPADARSTKSSGGYIRPSTSSSSSRTPSFSSSGSSSGSSSSGYTRPGSSSSSGSYSSGSTSDRAVSRSQSSGFFDSFTNPAPRRPDITPNGPSSSTSSRSSSGSGSGSSGSGSGYSPSYSWGGGSNDVRTPSYQRSAADDYYQRQRYYPPAYAAQGPSSYGIFNAMLFWFLLDSLSNRSHAEFFANNRDDPGYRAWRQEAEKQAAENADLRAKLAQLDQQMAAIPGDKTKAGQLPPDVPVEAGLNKPGGSAGGGGKIILMLLFVIALGVIVWWMTRRKNMSQPAKPAKTVGGDGSALGAAAAILRNKASGAVYQPELFRVGMPLTLDPTPFILGGQAIKASAPAPNSGSGNLVVDAVGRLADKAGGYHRLYLDDQAGFFQLVVDQGGQPSECRYFTRIDEVHPSSEDEWGFWLDKQDGMIGWPEFETKDGQSYRRLWMAGDRRIDPRQLTETITTLDGASERALFMMLYARPTGLKDPAPPQEYLLVTAVRAGEGAWVELYAGIDVNPSALSLS